MVVEKEDQDSPVVRSDASRTQSATQAQELPEPLIAGINLLKERSFAKKSQAIDQLQSVDDPRTIKILKYLLTGSLYYRKKDKLVVYFDKVRNDRIKERLDKNQTNFKKIILFIRFCDILLVMMNCVYLDF